MEGEKAHRSGSPPRVALLVPCLNEEQTIGDVIAAAKESRVVDQIVVGDNNSSDLTAQVAVENGVRVISVMPPGKGHVMRRLFADVEADVYVMVDGDATYEMNNLEAMVRIVNNGEADLVIGARETKQSDSGAFRKGHRLGNWMLTWIFGRLFSLDIKDSLSGYRVMSRRFVKSFAPVAEGFDIETDLNVHAAMLGCGVAEIPCAYQERPEGSNSKLRTYSDGWRILRRNLRLFRDARPQFSFALLALPWILAAAVLVGIPVVEFIRDSEVLRFPSLIAGVGAFIVGVLLLHAGLVLSRTTALRKEMVVLRYLEIPGPGSGQKTMGNPDE